MTKDRDFKKLVRERMARTGERYAAARAQLTGTDTPAGLHPETASLARLLVHAGITGPGGAKPSEALLLGLGGGIGASCFTFEYKGHAASFYVSTRCEPQYAYGVDFVKTAAERFGATCVIAESTSPKAASKKLAEHVSRGPAIAWVDLGSLPWSRRLGGAAELGAMPHVVVVESIDGDTAIVRDTPGRQFAIELDQLAAARKRLRAGKHRVLSIEAGVRPDWRAVFGDAIAACAAGLRGRTKIKGSMAKNFGVGGLRRWVKALSDPKDAKAWMRVFPPADAASGLAWTRHWIEHAGTGGAGFRPLYADFLGIAKTVMKKPALDAIARDYRSLAAAWSELATALLPDAIPKLAAIRKAQDARHAAFAAGDLEAMAAAEDRVSTALAVAKQEPPLDAVELRAHYHEVGGKLSAIVDLEEACAERLAAVQD